MHQTKFWTKISSFVPDSWWNWGFCGVQIFLDSCFFFFFSLFLFNDFIFSEDSQVIYCDVAVGYIAPLGKSSQLHPASRWRRVSLSLFWSSAPGWFQCGSKRRRRKTKKKGGKGTITFWALLSVFGLPFFLYTFFRAVSSSSATLAATTIGVCWIVWARGTLKSIASLIISSVVMYIYTSLFEFVRRRRRRDTHTQIGCWEAESRFTAESR